MEANASPASPPVNVTEEAETLGVVHFECKIMWESATKVLNKRI